MTARTIFLPLIAVAFVGCASRSYDVPINVTSNFNPEAANRDYKTWNSAQYENLPSEGALSDASFRLEIANMVEEALEQ